MATLSEMYFEPDTSAAQCTPPKRAEAELAYLRAIQPELARQVERVAAYAPELATRAGLAGLLVVVGAVTPAGPGEVMPSNGRYHCTAAVLGRVRVDGDDAAYLLTREPFGGVICNCADAQPSAGEPGAPRSRIAPHTCAHILALVLQYR